MGGVNLYNNHIIAHCCLSTDCFLKILKAVTWKKTQVGATLRWDLEGEGSWTTQIIPASW